MPDRRVLAAAAGAACVTALWVLFLTRAPGPGVSPDGTFYLGAAESLARGHPPRVPFADWSDGDSTARLRDYPPGFPAAIALASRAAGSTLRGARVVLAASAGVSVGVATLLVGWVAGPIAGVAGAIALLVMPAFIEDHSIVLSEPLYLALMMLVLALMTMDDMPALLVGALAAASVMVRYVGLSVIGAAALFHLMAPGGAAMRLRRAALAAGPGLAAFVAWNRWAGGAREYGWKPGFMTTLAEGVGTAQAWLAPALAPGLPRAALAFGLVTILVVVLVQAARQADAIRLRRLLRGCGLLAAGFAALMTVSRLFADGAIIFDNRLTSPLALLGVVAVAASCGAMWRHWARSTRALAVLIPGAWLAGTIVVASVQVRELMEDGWGYASHDWQASDLAQWLREDGARHALFSDNPPSVWSLVQRPSRRVPDVADSATVADLGEVLRSTPSAIISFKDPYTPSDPHGEVFAKALGFVEALRSDEGSVWVSAHRQ